MSVKIGKSKHRQSVIRALYTDDSEKSNADFVENQNILSRNNLINMGKFRKLWENMPAWKEDVVTQAEVFFVIKFYN